MSWSAPQMIFGAMKEIKPGSVEVACASLRILFEHRFAVRDAWGARPSEESNEEINALAQSAIEPGILQQD